MVPTSGTWSDAAVLLAALAVLLGAVATRSPIETRGEAREGVVVRSVVRDAHRVLPRREGAVPSKPPLFHWIGGGIASVAGLSDTSVRMPSVLAAWVLLVTTVAMGRMVGGRVTGWFAGGALLGMTGFWRAALEARVDMVFAACVTLALAGALRQATGGRGGRTLLPLAAAAAVLAKGPIGMVLPGLIVGGWWLVHRPRAAVVSVPSTALAGAIVVGWYVFAWADGGRDFVVVQLMHENLNRFVGRGSFERQRHSNPLKLLGAFAVQLAPWNVLALPRRLRGMRPADALLHWWWIVVLVVFTIAAGKRAVYLLPLYPAVAVLAAGRLTSIASRWTIAAVVLLDVGAAAMAAHMHATECAGAPPPAFARAVTAQVRAGEPISAAWSLTEPDRQVLVYQLDRSLPRPAAKGDVAPWMLAAEPVLPALAAHCRTVVRETRDHGAPLLLLACAER